MRNLLIFLLFSLSFLSNCFAEQLEVFLTASDNATALYNGYFNAQTFNLSAAATVTSIKLEFGANTGSPTGDCEFRIENITSGKPNGTLAHANLTKSQAITPSDWNTVTFDSSAVLAAGNYAIVPKVTGGDGSNIWRLRRVLAGGYSEGDGCDSPDASTWTIQTWDYVFEVLGTFSPPAAAPVNQVIFVE